MKRSSYLGQAGLILTLALAGVLAGSAQCVARHGDAEKAKPDSVQPMESADSDNPAQPVDDKKTEVSKPIDGQKGDLSVGSTTFEKGSNNFAFNLYDQVRGTEGNLFFSPYSISTALAMADEGAKGQTAAEIEAVFGFPANIDERRKEVSAVITRLNPHSEDYELSVANAFWAQKDYALLDPYTGALKHFYASEARNLDFVKDLENSRLIINGWVEKQTHDKIKDLFPAGSLDSSTRLVLTNAVYFKGKWEDQFNKDYTSDQPFRSPDGERMVPTMQRLGSESKYSYAETDELQVLELPYEGEELSMLVLLPKGDELSGLEAAMNQQMLDELRGKLSMTKINVYLPKFTFSSSYELSEQLSALGMPKAFIYGQADFSGMDGTHDLYIGLVMHKAFVDVSEEGTEAAAATGIAMRAGSAMRPEKPLEFRADHPFIFLIQEKKSGMILFMGRVENPAAQ